MTILQTSPPRTVPADALAKVGRLAGAAWFLLLAFFCAWRIPALLRDAPQWPPGFAQSAPILSSVCTLAFFMILAWLMLARPAAVARDVRLTPQIVSLAGTYGAWTVAFLPQAQLSPTLTVAAASVTLAGGLLTIYTVVQLGRSFSISPQARSLVTAGPYALVRNPLYLAEEIAIVGLAMHVIWWTAAPFLLVHIGLQVQRMAYEERVLRAAFPGYADYARTTARLIPGLW